MGGLLKPAKKKNGKMGFAKYITLKKKEKDNEKEIIKRKFFLS